MREIGAILWGVCLALAVLFVVPRLLMACNGASDVEYFCCEDINEERQQRCVFGWVDDEGVLRAHMETVFEMDDICGDFTTFIYALEMAAEERGQLEWNSAVCDVGLVE